VEQAPQRRLPMTDAWFARRAERLTLANRTDLPVAVCGWRGRVRWSVPLWLGVLVFALHWARCNAQADPEVLASSVLSYRFHTAPLAPIYLSEYSITVEPSRSARLWYRFGPGNSEAPGGSAAGITHTFQLDRKQYRELIETLAGAGVLAGKWTPSATLIGASQESVTVQEPAGKTITISSALEPEAKRRFLTVVDAMRATVPMAAWVAKDREQKTYQGSAR